MISIKDYIQRLFQYNHNANLAMIDSMLAERPNGYMAKTMSHIINAQYIWFARLREDDPAFGVWDLHNIDQMEGLEQMSFGQYKAFLSTSTENDFNNLIKYKNSKGENFQRVLTDMLFHVINHGTYHRGQMALYLRQNELDTPMTDYIYLGSKEKV